MSRLEREAAALDAATAGASEPKRSALVRVPIDDVMTTTATAVRFLVEPHIPRGVVTMLGGHGGAGKSNLALTIAAHVAAGRSWCGLPVIQGRVVYVSLEDPGDLVRYRLRRIIEAYGLPADAVLANLMILDGTDLPAGLMFEANLHGTRGLIETDAMDGLREAVQGADLVIIDNASDAADFDENVRRYVRQFVRTLAKLARDNDAGVMLLAHIDKAAARHGSQGNSYSGSTAWHNSVRSRLALLPKDGAVELVHEKANLSRPAEPMLFTWSDSGVLMPAATGRAEGAPMDTEHVIRALRAAQAASVDVGAARTGPSTAQSILATFDELPEHLRGPKGRSAFWSAVGKLQASGTVEIKTITTPQRKQRKVMVLCASSDGLESARANPPHPLAPYGAQGVRGFCASPAPIEPAQTGAVDDAEVSRLMAMVGGMDQ